MDDMWTIKRCMDWTTGYLEKKGIEHPRVSAEWMLTKVCDLTRVQLYMFCDRPLEKEELDRMHEYVVRRAKGEPVQYIVGETQFRTLDIACEPGVLIPRPETELLVEEVLNFLDTEVLGGGVARRKKELPWNAEVEEARQAELERLRAEAAEAEEDADDDGDAAPEPPAEARPEPAPAPPAADPHALVLEIGSGTGCISLSLAAERPGLVSCVATDIEAQAVALSCRNRELAGLDEQVVRFLHGDLVSPVPLELHGCFDVLVSNPPYIPEAVMARLPEEVSRYEPRVALASGADGLDMFRRILRAAPRMLRPGGLLACELHEEALTAAAELAEGAGFASPRVVDDLAGRPRILLATWPARA